VFAYEQPLVQFGCADAALLLFRDAQASFFVNVSPGPRGPFSCADPGFCRQAFFSLVPVSTQHLP
jgi:hypothetical protein